MGILTDIITILILSAVVIYLCGQIKLPVIVGFLLTGVLVGPGGFRLIAEPATVNVIAEMGVVLLLFTVGLEVSLLELLRLRRMVFLCGSLQVLVTVLVFFLLAWAGGWSPREALVAGFLVSLSSTAVVIKILQERAELDTPHGNIIMGILIFQDLSVVPMMLSIPLLVSTGRVDITAILSLIGEIAVVLGALFILSRWIIPSLLFHIARTRSRELFLFVILALCLSVAWITGKIGLSLAIGAFIAGTIISDSEYSQQALGNILPFRDVFTSFFFVSIGMLFDVRFLLSHPFLIMGVTAISLVVKAMLAMTVILLTGVAARVAVKAGIALAQVGEFSFVLAAYARGVGIVSDTTHQIFLGVSVISMALTPFLIAASGTLSDQIMRLPLPRRLKRGTYPERRTRKKDYRDHLVIVGYGFNGRNLARAAKMAGIPYVVIEMNPKVVKEERKKDDNIYFGDATQESILEHVKISQARAVAIVINDPFATRRIVQNVRQLNDRIYILARTRYLDEIKPLKALGADDVIPEEFETSVAIFRRILDKYLLPKEEIETLVEEIRSDNYKHLRDYVPDYADPVPLKLYLPDVDITSFRIRDGSFMAGKTLMETEMRKKYGVTLLAVNRSAKIISNPPAEMRFEEGDILFVVGEKQRIAEVKSLFNKETAASLEKISTEE